MHYNKTKGKYKQDIKNNMTNQIKFTKMHGIGNDYVYVNCFEESIKNPAEVSKFVSDRHFGIGSDGLILISPSAIADFRMNIYIGNLNYRVRESDLQQILEEYGVVDSVKIIVDRDTKRSKGFAFAEMPNAAEAQKAIEELNQAEYEGRQMVVKEAIPRR